MANKWLLWTLFFVCVLGGSVAFAFGARVPGWIGTASVLVFIVAEAYFLSLRDDAQSTVSAVQELPLVAFYLGWFVRPRLALALIALCVVVFGTAMVTNPVFSADGALGTPVAVHGLLSLLFCFSAGNYLWRRTYRRAILDPLTGAYNRLGFLERVSLDLLARPLDRSPVALVVIDFDGFKRLNDTRGHAAGDAALSDTVEAWRSAIRAGDVIGRVGGDEFALLLPRTDEQEAVRLVTRLQRLSEHPWSWGLAVARPGDTEAALLARADRALYGQKRSKRSIDG